MVKKGYKQSLEHIRKRTIVRKTNGRFIRFGKENHQWKETGMSNTALHNWVRRYLGRPDICKHCGRSNLSGHAINWANKSHEYKRDLEDWLRLCVKCHRAYDRK